MKMTNGRTVYLICRSRLIFLYLNNNNKKTRQEWKTTTKKKIIKMKIKKSI